REPEMTLQTSSASIQTRSSPGAGAEKHLPNELPRQLSRTKTLRLKEAGDEGLDSYDLARRQGSKVDMFKKMKSEEASLAKSEEQPTQCGVVQEWCAWIVKSHVCEVFFALMIVSNSAYLGVQLEWSSQNRDRTAEQQNVFVVINTVYAVIFLVEVCLRLVASGPGAYFLASGWAWNWLDVFVVTSTWVELGLGFFEVDGNEGGMSNSNLRLLRVIKVTRLARVLRVLRVVQFVRPLRTLMHCLVDTTKSFVWSLMLLVLMMYVFGLLFTDAAIDHIRVHASGSVDPDLDRFFGTVQPWLHGF
ncbi:Scn11a, partial [Symbiodinium pilosum]